MEPITLIRNEKNSSKFISFINQKIFIYLLRRFSYNVHVTSRIFLHIEKIDIPYKQILTQCKGKDAYISKSVVD